jgi:hypothetical protein
MSDNQGGETPRKHEEIVNGHENGIHDKKYDKRSS